MDKDKLVEAERCEAAISAFDALGYTAQFNALSDSARLEWGGTAIGISPRRFLDNLRTRAAALRSHAQPKGDHHE